MKCSAINVNKLLTERAVHVWALTDTFHLRPITNAEDDIKTCLKQAL